MNTQANREMVKNGFMFSEAFIENFKDRNVDDWEMISHYQELSEAFQTTENTLANQKLSDAFIEEFLLKN